MKGIMMLQFKWKTLLAISIISAMLYELAPPEGLSISGYHLSILFIATIICIIFNIMPTGAIAVLSIAVYCLVLPVSPSSTVAIKTILHDFSNPLIWLIVVAFMVAKAFSKTGLGERVSLILLKKFGTSSLKIAYCLGVADYMLAPATPSNTARFAITSPIANSLAKAINVEDKKLGEFLISNASAMNDASAVGFSTAFAGNLALIGIASTLTGINLTFSFWVYSLLLPSMALLVTIPLILYYFISPKTKSTPEAPAYAIKRLQNIGKISKQEITLSVIFVLLIILWVAGSLLNIDVTVTAFIGLSAMVMLGVLSWDDIKSEKMHGTL